MTSWILTSIADVAVYKGLVGGPFGSKLVSKDYVDDGVPVIRGKNLGWNRWVSFSDSVYVTEEKVHRDLTSNIAMAGDLVYTQRGTLGQVAIMPRDAGPAVISQSQMRLRVDEEKADPLFVYYVSISPDFQSLINDHAIVAGVPHINLEILKGLPLLLPSMEVQKSVAGILSSLDDLIENNRQRIKLLEEIARTIYREWFVKFRFPGHERVPLVDSELGPIPEGWKLVELVGVADITMGQSPKSEFYNDDGIGRPFHQGVTDFGAHFPRTRKWCSVDGRQAGRGDVLVSVRAPVGRINVAEVDITIGRGLAAIRARDGHQALLLAHLRELFSEEDAIGNDGAIFKSLGKAELASLPIIVAPPGVAAALEELLADNFGMILALTSANLQLESFRDLLLPRLVTGQIDISKLDLDVLLENEVA